jgi:hypothetical protein
MRLEHTSDGRRFLGRQLACGHGIGDSAKRRDDIHSGLDGRQTKRYRTSAPHRVTRRCSWGPQTI